MLIFNGAKRILQIMELNPQPGKQPWSTAFGCFPCKVTRAWAGVPQRVVPAPGTSLQADAKRPLPFVLHRTQVSASRNAALGRGGAGWDVQGAPFQPCNPLPKLAPALVPAGMRLSSAWPRSLRLTSVAPAGSE